MRIRRVVTSLLVLSFALLTAQSAQAQFFQRWKNNRNWSYSYYSAPGSYFYESYTPHSVYYPSYGYMPYSYSTYQPSYWHTPGYAYTPTYYPYQSNYHAPSTPQSTYTFPPLITSATPAPEPIKPAAQTPPEPKQTPPEPEPVKPATPTPPEKVDPPKVQQPTEQVVNVGIHDGYFMPQRIEIKPGTTVRWTNQGQKAHRLSAPKGNWESQNLNRGQSFSHTFTQPGTYVYRCALNREMTGTIVVK